MTKRRRLAFVSPRFLFPTDSGGKIRTTQILRGMKDGEFDITLAMPGSERQRRDFASEIEAVCDRAIFWEEVERGAFANGCRRLGFMFGRRPVSVMSDFSDAGANAVRKLLDQEPDVTVFDFPHSAVLAPETLDSATVMFTHNVESEIFQRHWKLAKPGPMRWVWKNQYRKMCRFEKETLLRFDGVVAVSDRDRDFFRQDWGVQHCESIPTGVDTEFFEHVEPTGAPQVVFCGSMDWMANVDAVDYFYDEVWPSVLQAAPGAKMKVVGRSPPEAMRNRICSQSPEWEFTGFVDDVRDHICGAAVFVIPLRVGGGTRIKAFEAMAMGCPVVSTSIGIEGLPVVDGEHYLRADEGDEMAGAVVTLLRDRQLQARLSNDARQLVVEKFGFRRAADEFAQICRDTHVRRCIPGQSL